MSIVSLLSKVRQLDLITNRNVTELFAGNYRSSFKGQGVEFAEVREYEPGDDARHIDWVVTARQGRPFVKKHQETRELTTHVLIDVSGLMHFGSTQRMKQQVALELAAILLFSAMKSGDKFGALIFADEVISYIPPRKGKSHLMRIFGEIINGFDKARHLGSDPQKALGFLNSIVKAQSICFFVGTEVPNSVEPLLKIANQKHDFVFCNVFDPFERAINVSDFVTITDVDGQNPYVIDLSNAKLRANYQKLREEKLEALKSMVRRNRIELIDCSTEDNLYKLLLLFFKRRQFRAR